MPAALPQVVALPDRARASLELLAPRRPETVRRLLQRVVSLPPKPLSTSQPFVRKSHPELVRYLSRRHKLSAGTVVDLVLRPALCSRSFRSCGAAGFAAAGAAAFAAGAGAAAFAGAGFAA